MQDKITREFELWELIRFLILGISKCLDIVLLGLMGLVVKKVYLIFLLTLLFIGVSSWYIWAQGKPNSDFTDEQIVDFYVEIAFGSEFSFLGLAFSDDQIAKRNQNNPIRIVPLPKPSVPLQESFALIKKVSIEMQTYSGGLQLFTYDESNLMKFLNRDQIDLQADYLNSVVVYIGSREELRASVKKAASNNPPIWQMLESSTLPLNVGKPLCMAASSAYDEGTQTIGMAIAWIEYGPRLEECLYEEIMQSFGIGNDFPAGTPSIFNDDGVYTSPTPLDWTLWRIHTDPRIVAGMKEKEVRKVAMEILKEIGE